jgi:hypothetical protein
MQFVNVVIRTIVIMGIVAVFMLILMDSALSGTIMSYLGLIGVGLVGGWFLQRMAAATMKEAMSGAMSAVGGVWMGSATGLLGQSAAKPAAFTMGAAKMAGAGAVLAGAGAIKMLDLSEAAYEGVRAGEQDIRRGAPDTMGYLDQRAGEMHPALAKMAAQGKNGRPEESLLVDRAGTAALAVVGLARALEDEQERQHDQQNLNGKHPTARWGADRGSAVTTRTTVGTTGSGAAGRENDVAATEQRQTGVDGWIAQTYVAQQSQRGQKQAGQRGRDLVGEELAWKAERALSRRSLQETNAVLAAARQAEGKLGHGQMVRRGRLTTEGLRAVRRELDPDTVQGFRGQQGLWDLAALTAVGVQQETTVSPDEFRRELAQAASGWGEESPGHQVPRKLGLDPVAAGAHYTALNRFARLSDAAGLSVNQRERLLTEAQTGEVSPELRADIETALQSRDTGATTEEIVASAQALPATLTGPEQVWTTPERQRGNPALVAGEPEQRIEKTATGADDPNDDLGQPDQRAGSVTPSSSNVPSTGPQEKQPVNLVQGLESSGEAAGTKSVTPADERDQPATGGSDIAPLPTQMSATGPDETGRPNPRQPMKASVDDVGTKPDWAETDEGQTRLKAVGPAPLSTTPQAAAAKEPEPGNLEQASKARPPAKPETKPDQPVGKQDQAKPLTAEPPPSAAKAPPELKASRPANLGQALKSSGNTGAQPAAPADHQGRLAAKHGAAVSPPSKASTAGSKKEPQPKPAQAPKSLHKAAEPRPDQTSDEERQGASQAAGLVSPLSKTPAIAAKEDQPVKLGQQLKARDKAEAKPAVVPPQTAGDDAAVYSTPVQPATPASRGQATGDSQVEGPHHLRQQLKASTPTTQPGSLPTAGDDVAVRSRSKQAAPAQPAGSETAPQSAPMQPVNDTNSASSGLDRLTSSGSQAGRQYAPDQQLSVSSPSRERSAPSSTPDQFAPAQVASQPPTASPPSDQPASSEPAKKGVIDSDPQSERPAKLGQQLKSSIPASQPVPAQSTGTDVRAEPTSSSAKQPAPLNSAGTPQSSASTPPPNRPAPTHSTNDSAASQSTAMQTADRGSTASLPINIKVADEQPVEKSDNLGQQLRSSSPPQASEMPSSAPQPNQPASIHRAEDRAASQAPLSDSPKPASPVNDSPAPQSTPTQPANPGASTPAVLNSTVEVERQEVHLGQELSTVAPPSQQASAQPVSGAASPSGQTSPAQPASNDAAPQPTPVQPTSHSAHTVPALNSERQAEEPRNFGQQLKSPAQSSQFAATQPVGREATTQSPTSPPNRPIPEHPTSDNATAQPTPVQSVRQDTFASPPMNDDRQTEEQRNLKQQLRSSASSPKQTSPAQPTRDSVTPQPPPVQPASHGAPTSSAMNSERQTEGQPNLGRQLKSPASAQQTGGKSKKESR